MGAVHPRRAPAAVGLVVGAVLALASAAPLAAQPPAPRTGLPTGQHSPAVETQLDGMLHAAIEAIYSSRITEARHIAEEAERLAPDDPRVHILTARILREMFPDQGTDVEHLAVVARPIHAALDRAIQCSDAILAHDHNSAAGYLYRGWAHLFRAQMHTLCDQYWGAGRQAKAGKNDVDRALELAPGNPDGEGIVGTYLYFADILPGVVKVASTIVRVPGGNRRRGLELLRSSAAGDGYNKLDARVLLGAIQFAFEGDYEAGTVTFESFLRDYPGNPRLLEPLAVLELMHPEKGNLERIQSVAQTYAGSQEDYYRELSYRLTFYQSLHEVLEGRAEDAVVHLEAVHSAKPTNPNWFPGDVQLCLVETQLLLGESAAAQTHITSASSERLEERLSFAADPHAAASAEEARTFRAAQQAARALYSGDVATARSGLAALGADDPAATFYRGELARIGGDAAAAKVQFEKLTVTPLPARWRFFKTLAFSRLADQQGAAGTPDVAVETLGRALQFDADRDLFRHLVRARRHYWELVGDGELRPTPDATTATRGGNGGK